MMRTLVQAVVLVALAASAAVGAYHFHPRAPALYAVEEPPKKDEVTLKQIQEKWQGQVVWLDARPQDQYDKGHIPEARLLNEQAFDQQLLAMLDVLQTTTKPVIIYCGGERCDASRKMREKLLQMVPIEDCYVLKGGWPAWQAEAGR